MFTFTIIILICILALGVSLLVSHWNDGAKRGETVRIDTLYKKNWRSFFWISLRVVSFALVTAFLFLMLLASFAGDDAGECCFWLMIFVVGSWFISIPIAIVYISSVVRSVWFRNYVDNIFLGLHCFNILQMLCITVFAVVPQKECTPETMEASYNANQQNIERLIKVTKCWLPDSTGFSVEYSKHGKLTDWGVSSKQEVNFKSDESESKKEQERELQKIGLSIEKLDSVRLALQKMGYRGLSVSRGGTVSDYTEIVYGVTGNKEFDYKIYDKPLTDSLVHELNRCYNLIVYNRYVVFSCVESFDYDCPFPGKYAYLQKHTLSK